MESKKNEPRRTRVRHKRIELSLLSELDPKSSASTNSANAARVRQSVAMNENESECKSTAFF